MPSIAPEIVDVPEQPTAVIRGEVPTAELTAFFDRAFAALAPAIARQGAAPAGAAFARYDGAPAEVARLEVGFPVDRPIAADGEVVPAALPAARVARAVHVGSYDGLGSSWGALAAWIADQGAQPTDDLWEVYVTQPSPDVDPAGLRTELYWVLA